MEISEFRKWCCKVIKGILKIKIKFNILYEAYIWKLKQKKLNFKKLKIHLNNKLLWNKAFKEFALIYKKFLRSVILINNFKKNKNFTCLVFLVA